MNNDQRKFLKLRVSKLRFDTYHQLQDDTKEMATIRKEVEEANEILKAFEKACTEKRRENFRALEAKKDTVYEAIYGNDYDLALKAIKSLENEFEKARIRQYGRKVL